MAISRIVPPLDYLREASRASLESFELTRLNHAANLRREIGALIDQWIQETSEAMLARWLMDHRQPPRVPPLPGSDILQAFVGPEVRSASQPNMSPSEIVSAPPRFSDSRRPVGDNIGRKSPKIRSAAAD